jgi:hypothetical protein
MSWITKKDIEKMRDMKIQGYPTWYIGEKIGCTAPTVWSYTKDICVIKPRWTPEEVKLLLKLREQEKMLMKDIAVRIGKDISACYKKYYALRDSLKTS